MVTRLRNVLLARLNIWDVTSENVPSLKCAQRRFRSACANAQSYETLHRVNFDSQGCKVSLCGGRRLIWVFLGPTCQRVRFFSRHDPNCFQHLSGIKWNITKTRLYNFDPLKPHLYKVNLGFTGVYIIFLIFAQTIDCGYSLEPPRRGGSNEYPQSMVWAEIWNISVFLSENFHFLVVNFSVYLNRRVFVMAYRFSYAKSINQFFFASTKKKTKKKKKKKKKKKRISFTLYVLVYIQYEHLWDQGNLFET